jgi:hypothetical protein
MFKYIQGICVFTLAAAALYAQTTPTPPAQVTKTSAVVGLAEGQTAQLNALNPGVLPPAVGAVCTGLLTIYDGQGVLLKSKTVSVPPGASLSMDVDSVADLALRVDERREIRATVTVPPVLPPAGSAPPTTPPCKLIGNLEIFDTLSGRTLVTLGVVHFVPNPSATTTPTPTPAAQ